MRANLIVVAIAIACAPMVGGCSFSPSKTSQESADKIASMLTYTKDSRTEQCYAMIEGSEGGNPDSSSLSITWVPCEPKVLEQANK